MVASKCCNAEVYQGGLTGCYHCRECDGPCEIIEADKVEECPEHGPQGKGCFCADQSKEQQSQKESLVDALKKFREGEYNYEKMVDFILAIEVKGLDQPMKERDEVLNQVHEKLELIKTRLNSGFNDNDTHTLIGQALVLIKPK